MADFASGFQAGFAPFGQVMSMYDQQQRIDLAQKQQNLSQWSNLVGVMNLRKDNPALAEATMSQYLPTLGMDPKSGSGKVLMDSLKNADDAEIKNLTDMAASMGAKNVPIGTLRNFASDPAKLMDYVKGVHANQDMTLTNLAAGAVPMPGADQAASTATPVAAGGDTTPATPPGTAASTAPQAVKPRMISVGGQQFPIDPAQGGLQAHAADLYDTYNKRADVIEAAAAKTNVQTDLPQKLREQANAFKDASTITLNPQQSAKLGYNPSSVIQYNLATGKLDVSQAGQDQWRLATQDELTKMGMKSGTVAYVNKQTGEPKVVQAGEDQWSVIPKSQNQALGLEPSVAFMKNVNSGEIKPVAGYQNEPALAAGQGSADVKELQGLRDQAQAANGQLKMSQSMGEMEKMFGPGLLAEPKLLVGRVADAFGLKGITDKLGTAEGDALESLYKDAALQLANKVQGRVSSKLQSYIDKAGPAIFKTAAGNKILESISQQSAQNSLDLHNLAEEHISQPNVRQLSQPDASGQNYYQKRDALLSKRDALTPEVQSTLDTAVADIGAKVRGVSNPISQATPQELKKLQSAGQKGQLSPQQLDLAEKRWQELKDAGQLEETK